MMVQRYFLLIETLVIGTLCRSSIALSAICSRRNWIIKGVVSSSAFLFDATCNPSDAKAAVESLPTDLRKYTALAPLGDPTSTGTKQVGLSLTEIASRLSHDLVQGSTGKGGYFVSGDISTELFRDDCNFVDPTNSVASLSRYQNALKILFDPEDSFVSIVEPLVVNESKREVTGRIRSGGVLKLPWKPRISPYESQIVWKIDDNGLIESQDQEWSISASQALQKTFTPNAVSAPFSTLAKPENEPEDVTKLFELVNGHRPDSIAQTDRFEIANLINKIVDARYEWKKDDLPGKWALVYLQPGPEGGGIDRRIPFPEFWFNNNYQIFSKNSVTNVGEIFGPLLEVRVGGSLEEEDETSLATPKRFRANIDQGDLCLGQTSDKCIPLPISGEGLFDGVYLGKRLRIGQNLNGGGARVVQVKI